MNTRPFPGGMYIDALPTGEYVVLYPGRFLGTHLGNVFLPPGEDYGPMNLKMSPTKDRFVGRQYTGTSPHLHEYHFATGWRTFPTPVGRPVYSTNGVVLDTLPAGYGYFDTDTNLPVSYIKTYERFNGLSSWCKVGGLYIGQGSDTGGVLVWDGATLRVLDTGPCNEINAHAAGEAVSVAYRKDNVGCFIQQTSFAELRALPLAPGQPTPPVTPPPPPPPEPKPVPTLQAPDEFNLVQRVREAFNLRDEERHGPFLDEVIRTLGGHPWGRKLKNDGVTLNTDVLAFERDDKWIEYYDVIIGDGSGNVGWGPTGPFKPGDNGTWVAVKGVEPGPVTPPTPPPVPSGTGLLDTRKLDAVIAELRAANAALVARVEHIDRALLELSERPGVEIAGGHFAIRTENGHYIRAEGGGGAGVFADRTKVEGHETFTLEPR